MASQLRLRSLSPTVPGAQVPNPICAPSSTSGFETEESDAKIMERIQSTSEIDREIDEMTLEEKLLEKMDAFLLKLEKKFTAFENYFNTDAENTDENSRGSKSITESYTRFYNVLLTLRDSRGSMSHLEKVNKILEESYGNLYNKAFHKTADNSSSNTDIEMENIEENQGFINNEIIKHKKDEEKSAMYQRLLTGLHFLDEKIDQVEKALNIPVHQEVYELKDYLYNYEKALVNGSKRLLHFYELPFQWRENKYIMFGHRFNQKHFDVLKSICQCHNETTNIWTHLVGSMYLIYLALYKFPNSDIYQYTDFTDKAVFATFFLAALNCLIFSVLWHSWCNISTLALRQRFACVDYTGITVLITASIITTEHIALKANNILKLSFMSFSLLAGCAGVVFTWSDFFDKPECRSIRILFFVSLAGLGVSAFFSVCYIEGLRHSLHLYFPLCRSFVFYLTGVVFYGCLIPERWRSDVIVDEFDISDDLILKLDSMGELETYLNKQPTMTEHSHKFWSLWWIDYFLNSHNIWHLFVIGGILGHYSAILEMFQLVLESNQVQ